MMQYLMLTCREATRLTEKKLNSGSLSLIGNLQLALHLRMCARCRRYAEQSAAIETALQAQMEAMEEQEFNREGEPPEIPQGLRERLLQRLEEK